MPGFRKFSCSQQVSAYTALLTAALYLAFLPLFPRNVLRASDLALGSSYTVIQLDSVFRTRYNTDENPYKGSGWKAFQRFSWFYTQRAYPEADIPAGARMQAWEEKQQARHNSPLDENWSAIGPNNLAGRILCLAWHPTDANTIYAGTASGGLWKTVDGGANWLPLTDDLPSLAVGAVALEPGNPNVIYIGTGEGSFNADAVYGAGIFKSTDGGTTWSPTGLSWTQSQSRAINKIVINPSNPQIIYAACNRVVGGIFKSVNGGTTWTQYHAGDVKDLIIHPDSLNILYCVSGDPWGNAQNGIFRSADSGVTWTRLSSGLPAATSMGRAQLSMAPSNHQTLYVGISQTISAGAGLLGIYKTANAGASWTLQANTPNFYSGQGWYNLVIAVHPTNAAVVYSSGLDCYKSTDSGVTWTRKSVWSYPPGNAQYAHADHHELIFKPGDPNTILVGTDGGIYKSINGGDTWAGLNNGLVCYQFYAMGNDALNASTCYGGTQDNGTNKYTGSNTWSWVMSGDGGYCTVDYTNSNIVYAEIQRGSHYKSTNAGSTWSYIQTGISGYGEWVTPVAMDPTNPSILYTGTTQVYKTTNGGASWSAISSSFSSYYVSTLAVAPSNPQVIYAGIAGGGQVWKTTNGGTNWTSITTGLPNRYVTRVAVHPADPNTIYVTFSGYASGHVWKSTNGGSSWTNVSTGIPDIPCNVIAIDGTTPSTMYVGTDLGVYRSTDGGASWADYSIGLPNVVVEDLALHPSTGSLRAATHGRGMWETSTGAAPSITVLTPNGGDSWPTGTNQAITWTTGGLGGNVRIELNRTFPGGSWEVLIASTPNDGSYTWTVAGTATTTARMRVTSVETPSATDVSNSDFSITPPVLTLLQPNGGETYVLGTVDTIAWTLTGTSGAVVVQINRTYPSASWEAITTTSSLSTPYTVSGTPSNTVRVRAYLQSTPSVGDTSAANLSIVAPAITVNWPNGGETLTPGQSVMLRWTSANVTGTVRVELNRTYPGGTWETLNANVTIDSLAWAVDQYGGSSARIRVTSNTYSAATDVSNGNFTISTPSLTVVTPNGGEGWSLGSSHWLRWMRSNLNGLVNVYYNLSYPSGTWQPVQLNVALDSVLWVVPGPASGATRVRVTSVNVPTLYDESDANFSLGSGITLIWPNGGENLSLTAPAAISWTRANAPGNVTVQLNRTYPMGVWEPLTTTAAGDSHTWTVSGATATGARIRVFLTSNPTLGDTSDASFNIVSSVLAVTSPNGGELWNTHMYQVVRWTRTNVPGDVTVLLNRSYPSGTWDTLAAAVSADTLRYYVPDWNVATSTARAKVVWNEQPVISDASNSNFSIVPHLTLLYPNGGEVWPIGTAQTIRWSRSNSPGNVRILLTRTWPTLTWTTLTTTAAADSFQWTPPYAPSENCRVAIYMTDNYGYTDTSAANFAIANTNSITVTSPNGGEQWAGGSSQTITFVRSNAAGAATVQLNRTYPSGTWENLNTNVTTNSLNWTVSGSASSNARVRVFLNSTPSLRDSSNADFSISSTAASLALTSPNGGETWVTGSTQVVRFTRTNAAGNVVVLLNRTYPGGVWETLSSTVTTDTFAWNASGTTSSTARVRIYLASNATIADTSAANFSIVTPMITVVGPNGGESWTLGSSQMITFTRSNAPGNATVELNRTYPSGAWELLSNAVSSSSYAWTVSGTTSATVRTRVYLTATPAVGDTSNANFFITGTPALTLTAPNGGETWVNGSPQVVRFTRSNAAGNVTVQLNRTYPSATWDVLSTAVSADTFAWTASGIPSVFTRIRVFLTANATVGDTSNANFTIAAPTITVTAPNGGETWSLGSTQSVTFTRSNANGNATVELNRTYPSGTWELLNNAVSGSSYSWVVSGATSSAARIRVYLTGASSIGDTSNAGFTISGIPTLTMTAPNGGESWNIGTSQTISFTRANAAGTATLELNRNYPSGTWELISNSVAGSSVAWTPTGAGTSTARIRVYLNATPEVGDTSNANFTLVAPAITVTAPNGNDTLYTGATYSITWTRQNASGGVTVGVNRSYPAGTWESITTNSTVNSYAWVVSGPVTDSARIRVTLNSNPAVGDTSNQSSRIVTQTLSLTAPDGGESFTLGAPITVRWTRSFASGDVTVMLNRNYPAGAWQTLTTAASVDSFVWNSSGTASSVARMKIQLSANSSVNDISAGNFSLVLKTLALTTHNAAATYYIGTPSSVNMSRTNASGNVTIQLNRNYPLGTWETLTTSETTSSYLWNITGQPSTVSRLRIFLTAEPFVGDTSNASFTLASPVITVSAPNGGEIWPVDSVRTISWVRGGVSENVRVDLNRSYPSGSWETLLASSSGSSFAWTVTGPTAAGARMRVVGLTTGVSDQSDANFSIPTSQLTLLAPNGGEDILIGGLLPIRWIRNGASGAVNVHLNRAYPSGAWELLGSSTSDSLTWTASGSVSTSARTRVTLQSNPGVGDTSDANFAIINPQLSVLSPNGGEQFVIGMSYYVNISRVSHPGPVTIQLNRSFPSADWQTIVSNYTGSSYLWLVSAPYSRTARIRVISEIYPSVGDTSNGNFRIAPFGILVLDPSSADTVAVGDTVSLAWVREGVGSVDVLLDRDWPSDDREILTSDLDADSFSWTATPPASSNCRFIVWTHADSTIADTSDYDFAIHLPSVTLTTPAGGETYSINDLVSISWTRNFATGGVRVELNRNYPSGSWDLLADNVTGNSASWTVDGDSTSHARVRLTLIGLPYVGDTCATDFHIAYPGLHLTSPNGNDTLVTGTTQIIRWDRINAPGQVRVDLNRNYPSGTWEVLASAVSVDTFAWNVTGTATTQACFRVTLVFNATMSDVSDALTWITPPLIQLLSPVAGDSIQIGVPVQFSWSRVGVAPGVNLYVKRNYPSGQWELLGQNLTGNSWSWTAAGAASEVARFRALSGSNPAVGDTTDGPVHLGQPLLTFTNPVSAQSYRAGEVVNLTWTRSYAPGAVRVELSRQGTGGPWEELGTTSGNLLAWTVSGPATTIARLRITLMDLSWVATMTSFNNSIVIPSLAVTAPTSAGPFAVGRDLTISWQRSNVPEAVNVYVERDGQQSSLETVRSSVTGDSVHWTATAPISSNARIVVRTAFGLLVEGQSSMFSLAQPLITLTHPTGGQSFVSGNVMPVRWNRTIITDPVQVELNRGYPAGSWVVLATGVTDTIYNWTVSGPTTQTARVRVLSTVDPALGDTSDASISLLQPTLTITSPVSGARLPLGFDTGISWTRIAVEGSVNIELSRDGGSSYELVADSIGGDSYAWTPDGAASDNSHLRITSIENPSVSATSNVFVLAQPSISLLSMNGGDSLAIGSPIVIRWSETDHPGAVDILLNRNYPGDVWETLAGAVESDSFVWTPSGIESPHARVRVQSVVNSDWFAQSAADFALLNPALVITSPAEGTELIVGDPLTITWQRTLSTGLVRVLLRRADGGVHILAQGLPGSTLASTVPTVTSTVSTLIVEDMQDPTRADSISLAGPYLPRLSIMSVTDSSRYVIGRPEVITWSRDHAAGDVSLQMSPQYPITGWTTIATTSGDSIAFVPDGQETESLAVRVILLARPAVADTVVGIRVVNPALELANLQVTSYRIGSTMDINWSNHEVDGAVLLELNRSYPVAAWETLYTGTDTSLAWTVSGDTTDAARLRIVSADYPQAADTSAFTLNFYRPSLMLTIDAVGDTLFIGHDVHYSLSLEHESPLMDVAVQREAGGAWEIIQSGVAEGAQVWTLTGPASGQLRFRAYVPGDAELDDTSRAFTLLTPALDFLTTPPTIVNTGDDVYVSWSALGVDGPVNLWLLRDQALPELLASDQISSYDWSVTPPHADNARLVVSAVNEPQFSDTSAAFAIRDPQLFFTNPTASGTDTIGQTFTLSWNWIDGEGAVRLDVSYAGVSGPWLPIADSISAQSVDYLITGPATMDLRYRVRSVADSAVFAISAQRSVIEAHVSIDSFSGGTWFLGEQHWIRWTRENYSGPVDIELQRMDRSQPWEPIAQSVSDSILWTVTGPASDYAMLRLVLPDYPTIFDTTDAPLRIAAPHVTVVAPNGGETLEEDQQIRLRWIAEGFEGGVGIGLWRGDPVNRLDTLFLDTPNDSSEIWTITGPAATGCYLVMVAAANPSLMDTSDAAFVIQAGNAAPGTQSNLPTEYSLDPPYPNPFNSQATIEFALPKNGHVELTVFDILGRTVTKLVDEQRVAGYHHVQWDASRVGSGIYFVRMTSEEFVATRKLHLIK